MESRKYLSCAETAKLLRQALKESFPGVKFSVRSSVYSGGANTVGTPGSPGGGRGYPGFNSELVIASVAVQS